MFVNVVHMGKHARGFVASIFQKVETVWGVLRGCLVRQRAESVVLAFVFVEELLAESQFVDIMDIGTPRPRAFACQSIRHQGTECTGTRYQWKIPVDVKLGQGAFDFALR